MPDPIDPKAVTQSGVPTPLLSARSIVVGYGKKRVLNRVTVDIGIGEIVAVVGRNGAGKSTLLKALCGLLPVWEGQVILHGRALHSPTPRETRRLGVVYVPQGNRVFTNLTVRENLEVGGITLDGRAKLESGIERALNVFTALKPRLRQRAGTLSGGEKQMLALANALILSPRVLLLDEPSLGLAPQMVPQTLKLIHQLSLDTGMAALVVEQKVREVLKIARRMYVFRGGQTSFTGPSDALDDAKIREVF